MALFICAGTRAGAHDARGSLNGGEASGRGVRRITELAPPNRIARLGRPDVLWTNFSRVARLGAQMGRAIELDKRSINVKALNPSVSLDRGKR